MATEKNNYSFNRMVSDFIKHLVNQYRSEGKEFVFAKGAKLDPVTESFHSGGLTPLLFWELDNRRFEMWEGYRRTGPVDWFRHNSQVNFLADNSTLLGVRMLNIQPENLPMSKQDLLLHLADAMESLYHNSPAGNVYLDRNKEQKFKTHLNEKEQNYEEKISKIRVINPLVEQYHAWRSLYENFAIAVISDPNMLQENRLKFEDDITYQLVRKRLEELDGVSLPRELYGENFQPYHKQLQHFIEQQKAAQLTAEKPVVKAEQTAMQTMQAKPQATKM